MNDQPKGEDRMVYNQNNDKAPVTGVLGTVFGGSALAGMLGILGGNGGGLFGNSNPTASSIYQLAQKDTVIAKLEAERCADARFYELSHRLDAVEGRVLSMETATPLRDKILSDSILNLQANLANISGYMVKASAIPEAA